MTTPLFVCPRCGGTEFGRDTASDATGTITTLPTVRCQTYRCQWRGKWPRKPYVAIVREIIRSRHKITPAEMKSILSAIHAEYGTDSLANGYVPHSCDGKSKQPWLPWMAMLRGTIIVSVGDNLRDGNVRYDQSMPPTQQQPIQPQYPGEIVEAESEDQARDIFLGRVETSAGTTYANEDRARRAVRDLDGNTQEACDVIRALLIDHRK